MNDPTNSVVNKAIVLSLNGSWMPIGHKTVKQAIKDLCGGEFGGEPPSLALDIEYPKLENGEWDFAHPTYMNPVKWDKWCQLPIREYDLVVHGVNFNIRAPTVLIAHKFTKMPLKKFHPTKDEIFRRDKGVCFVKNTSILMKNGNYKFIQDINVGDYVIDKNGHCQKVLHTFVNKSPKELIKLKSCGEHYNICTKDHPFFCIDKSSISMRYKKIHMSELSNLKEEDIIIKKSKDLSKGDCLIRPLRNIDGKFCKFDLKDFLSNNKKYIFREHTFINYHKKTINRFLKIDAELCFIFGLFLAEGCYKKSSLVFCLHRNETNLHNIIKNFCNKYEFTYQEKIRKKSYYIIISTGSWMTDLFKILFGHGCSNKFIHDIIFELPLKFKLEIIRGCCMGDACLYHNKLKSFNKTSYWTTSFNLFNQVRNICFDIGIYPSIQIVNRRNRKKTQYIINFMGVDNKNLWNFLNECIISNKRYIVKINGIKYLLTPITKIKRKKSNHKFVYNIEVENTNSYVANNVLVHNCQYSGKYVPKGHGTVDHILPRDKGGKNSFKNLVWCEKGINLAKGNRLNHEVGLKLIREPTEPKPVPVGALIIEARHADWRHFLIKKN